uniref:NADH-ubiquinone oxidoreductase chain 5 n=1 Tax=Cavenderia fasciculata TaxID=261658 RepID=B2XXA7_CACFS|nr:NADH dehydrogenase subunit 5 [Cavenderia fasciculata]ABX45229.1 NADH dehydrogenase subunit 5 [Cavenderia fasciculata]
MYILSMVLPLVSSVITGLFGHKLGAYSSIRLAIACMISTAMCSLYICYEIVFCNSVIHFKLGEWISSGFLDLRYGLLFDSLSSIMLVVITFISCMVHIYSVGYMSEDPHKTRFFAYLSLFTFFMMVLVVADNVIQFFLGWEGVGIMSYLLINFWYTRLQANKAALKAVFLNRFGDFGVFIAILLIYLTFNSFDFAVIFSVVPFMIDYSFIILGYDVNVITLISIFLTIGVIGKSAQLGLHMWLPDAMEGPTPVSALLHAATMVTAGVFLLLRFSLLMSYSISILNILTIIGALTTLFATSIGFVQNDIKRVIAYSTCAQLGYMIFSCGMLNYSASLYHLTTHAFFKALLFLSAGSVIHSLSDEQDMRKMGGLVNLLPLTYQCMLIGTLALTGFPFLSGYYSKDIILETSYAAYYWEGFFASIIGYVAAFGTTFYSFRLLFLTFFNKPRTSESIMKKVHDAPTWMMVPLIILSVCSIFIGYLTKDLFVGLGTNVWKNAFFTYPYNNLILESEVIQRELKFIPLLAFSYGVIIPIIYYFYEMNKDMYFVNFNEFYKQTYGFFMKKWYFDYIVRFLYVVPFFYLSNEIMNRNFDKGLWEKIGVTGLANIINNIILDIKLNNTDTISKFLFYIIQIVILLGWSFMISWDIDSEIIVIIFIYFFFTVYLKSYIKK